MLILLRFRNFFFCLAFLIFASKAIAEPSFPALTGRIVDNANLLSKVEKEKLEGLLRQHEDKTTNQLVIVTLPSLQGYEIADYGYQLGRHWQIGQSGKDNGVLLIVAPNERKVRIEVGYGLEGVLTDKLSNDIIQDTILPNFKHGDFSGGIEAGTRSIISVLEGSYSPTKHIKQKSSSSPEFSGIFIFAIFTLIIITSFLGEMSLTLRLAIGSITSAFSAVLAWHFTHIIPFTLFTTIVVFVIVAFSRSNKSNLLATWEDGGFHASHEDDNNSWDGPFGGIKRSERVRKRRNRSSGSGFGGGFGGGGGGFGGGGASGSW